MKQKLLTLATLLLCAVSGAWAEELCSAQIENGKTGTFSNTTGESASNCTLYYSGMQGGDNKVTISGIDYYKFGSNDAYVQLKYSGGAFVEGDVVSVMVVSNSGNKSFNLKFGKTNSSNFSCNASSATAITYTLKSGDIESDGSVKIYRGSSSASNIRANVFSVTGDRKEISTQAFAGVKEGSTTLTETTDYTVSGTVITLTASHKAVSAPTNITLTNHITYTDASTDDVDVPVSFDGTATDGYFVSDATAIGATSYTVKVPVDATPTLTLSAAAGEIALKSFEPTGSVKVTVTGANLTGDTFSTPTVEGVTIAPATATITDGAFSQEFTITSTATTAASTVIGFAHTGATTQNYTLTYSKTAQRSLAQADVTATTTWDWTKAGTNEVKLTDATSPSKSDEFVMSDIAEIDNDAEFNSQALKCRAVEYLVRDTKYLQGTEISFKTTKPGTVQVWFSNTGGSRPYRYLYVNGLTEYKSNSSASAIGSAVASGEITVPAGNIVVKGVLDPDASTNFDGYNEGSHGAEGSDQFRRIFKVIFTAHDAIEQDAIEVPCPGGLGTFYDGFNDLDFSSSSAQAYIVTAVTASAVTLTEVKKVPAGYGVIVKGASQGETVNVLTTTMTSDEITAFEALGNKLYAGSVSVTSDGQYWALSKTDGKFHPVKADVTIPAGKAYLRGVDIPASANFLSLDFGEGEGDVTGIEAVESHKVVNNNVFYNLAGQQVAQPSKGLYIVNGKKVIIK